MVPLVKKRDEGSLIGTAFTHDFPDHSDTRRLYLKPGARTSQSTKKHVAQVARMDPSLDELTALKADSKHSVVLAVVVCFTILSTSTVVLRFIARFAITKQPGMEDYFIGISQVQRNPLPFHFQTDLYRQQQLLWRAVR